MKKTASLEEGASYRESHLKKKGGCTLRDSKGGEETKPPRIMAGFRVRTNVEKIGLLEEGSAKTTSEKKGPYKHRKSEELLFKEESFRRRPRREVIRNQASTV